VRPFSFDTLYLQELRAIGQTLIQVHLQSMREAAEVMAGRQPFDPEVFMPSNATATILGIDHRLHEHGVPDEELWLVAVGFSVWTYYQSEERIERQDRHAARAELRSVIQRLQALPRDV
jgi:hypothetical protein